MTRRIAARLLAAELTLEGRVRAVREALWKRSENALSQDNWYAEEVDDAWVIARCGSKAFRVPYTIEESGDVTFGQPEEVEQRWEPVAVDVDHVVTSATFAEAAAGEPEGLVWGVDIMREGMSTTAVLVGGQWIPVYVTAEFLASLVPLLENAPVYSMGDTTDGHKRNRTEKLQGQSVGFTSRAKLEPGVVTAALHFDPVGDAAVEIRTNLVSAWRRNNPTRWGLSIDADAEGEVREHLGRPAYYALAARALHSTDIVIRPGAGGRFTQLAAAAAGPPRTEVTTKMNKRKRLLQAIRASRPAALEGKTDAELTWAVLADLATDAELQAAFAGGDDDEPEGGGHVRLSATELDERIRTVATTRAEMERIISDSKLPAKAIAQLRASALGADATPATVQAAVDALREILDEATPVTGLGAPVVSSPFGRQGVAIYASINATPVEKLQAAFLNAIGQQTGRTFTEGDFAKLPPLGLRQLYDAITCGHDPDVTGSINGIHMAEIRAAGFDEDTLSGVLSDAMNRAVGMLYKEVSYGAENLVSSEGSAKDFKPQEHYRWGYLGNLPVVNTDTEDYPVVNPYGEEKATYQIGERGFRIQITRRHLINDDLGHVASIPGKVNRAGKRTVADFILDFMVLNPVITLTPGTLTWFHATRNNLLTDALGVPGLNNARLKLANQVEPDSGKKLGLRKEVELHLWVPEELYARAQVLNNSPADPDVANAPDGTNPWYKKFGPNGERIHVVYAANGATWTVASWALSVEPSEREIIAMKYLNGQRVPQIVRADVPGAGLMFTRGSLELKAYLDFSGAPVDFRGVVKSVPA